MDHSIAAAVVLTEFMYLGMTVVAPGNAIVGFGCLNLIVFQAPKFQAIFFKSGLQKSTAATAAVIIGAVGRHIDKVFLSDNSFDDKTQIFSDGITITFAHYLAGILNRKLDF